MYIALTELVMKDTSKGPPVLTFSSLLCHTRPDHGGLTAKDG